MEYLRWIVAGTAMVGLLVVIHELGHFLVARLFGVGTPIFSFGIGPPLFTLFRWKDTRFVVSALPIGGYVQMSGADPFGDSEPPGATGDGANTWVDPRRDFMKKPVWQRFLIMLAGPAMNIALPFVLFTAVLMGGEPQIDNSIGTVIPGSPVDELGLHPGDRVARVDGRATDTWLDVVSALDDEPEAPIPLTIERGGDTFVVTLPAGTVAFTKDGIVDSEAIGFTPLRRSSRVGVSDPTSPAWRAGLRPGDAIVNVDGRELETFDELRAALTPGEAHALVVVRVGEAGAERLEMTLEPDPAWRPDPLETDPDAWGIVHASVFVGEVMRAGTDDPSAAARAGVKRGDRLVAVDGTRIRSWSDVLGLVARTVEPSAEPEARSGGCGGASPPDAKVRPLELEIVREGVPMTLELTPTVERELIGGVVNFRPIMGIRQYDQAYTAGPQIEKHYWPHEAFGRAVEECQHILGQTMTVLGGLLVRDIAIGEGLGGPIAIFRAAGDAAERGVFAFARMMGMISFSLGIVNLLPVPVLDGGQILFYAIEGIRGRPLPLALRERIQMVGVLLIGALFVVVMVTDVSAIFAG